MHIQNEFLMVSAPFASGVTWLLNVLLELGVRCDHPRYGQEHWRELTPNNFEIGEKASDHLRFHFPILHYKKSLEFQPSLRITWEHRLDFARDLKPVILYVRDPRDAIYSLWKRDYQDQTFEEFLKKPASWPDHFPGCFNLPPPETWALFHAYWMEMTKLTPLIVVKFEQMRATPVEEVERVLQFLGTSRTKEEINRALEMSSFEKAKAAMQQSETTSGRSFATAGKGKVNEWKETYTTASLERFAGFPSEVMEAFGYEITDSEPNGQPSSGIENCAESFPEIRQQIAEGKIDEAILALAALESPDARPLRAALRWSQNIFGASPDTDGPFKLAFDLFETVCSQNSHTPAMELALAVYKDYRIDPELIDELERFNFVQSRERFFAIDQKFSDFNLTKV
jgi:hypothetical protein